MVGPSRKQSIPVSALPIAMLVLLLVAGAIAVLSFALSKMQAPQEETGIDTNLPATCEAACRDCISQDYEARCFDRCRFGYKPYCD